MIGNAPIDFGPSAPREPRYADPLNGEVIVIDIEVPADLTFGRMTASWYDRELSMRLQEALRINETHGDKTRCIQLHIHHPDAPDHFVSHLTETDRERL